MSKTILLTGSTDGIGLETAKKLAGLGHRVLLHGRNPAKLEAAKEAVSSVAKGGGADQVEGFKADLSTVAEAEALAKAVSEKHTKLDVLINNAGVFKTSQPLTKDGLDVRFAVNAISPYILTQRLIPLLGASGRVVNVSSAAQSTVNHKALKGKIKMTDDFSAYAQSKLAITMWSRTLNHSLKENGGPMVVAVNPGSYLASKMVTEGFGVAGNDLGIGADILTRAAVSEEFATAGGKYFDNDARRFSSPHRDAMSNHKAEEVVRAIEQVWEEKKPHEG